MYRNERITHRAQPRQLARAFALACLLAAFAPGTAANDLCGTTILADLTLDHDLTCVGTALVVGADGITIDLNGHSITGSGSGFGIDVIGRIGVSISRGMIRNFAAGVQINASTGIVVEDNEFVENGEGVDCQAGCVGNTIKENQFRDSRIRGIMLRSFSTGNLIKENTFTGNRVGILVFGGTNSIVQENTVSASVVAGIRINVIATGNLIIENLVTLNPAGIEVLVTATGSAIGNTVTQNTLAMNTCGLKGPFAGNTVSENLFVANDADVCAS